MKSAFKTKEGENMAKMLAEHIAKTEAFQRWDECLNEVRQHLTNLADEGQIAPISSFFLAEDGRQLKKTLKLKRYRVKIHES